MTETKVLYNKRAKLHDKILKFRKWKVKDKNKFLTNQDNPILIKEALVYDCLENKTLALSEEEYKFMLIKIRETSLSKKVQYTFICSGCSSEFEYQANLDDIITAEFGNYSIIEFAGETFDIQRVQNREFYDNSINSCKTDTEKYIVDFILHIKSYNGNDGLNFAELNEVINNLDIEIFEHIFSEWEKIRFKTNNIKDVKCSKCGNSELYEFDDLPGFFPESWDINA